MSPALKACTASDNSGLHQPTAALAACRVVHPRCATPAYIVGADSEHIYQLNHVYVTPPTKATNVKTTDGRLFARLEAWDHTTKLCLALQCNDMVQLAYIAEGDDTNYEQRLGADGLRQPLLAAFRLRRRSKPQQPETGADTTELSRTQEDNVLPAVVVKTAPCTFTDIPQWLRGSNTWAACRLCGDRRTARGGASGQAQALAFLQHASLRQSCG